MDGRMQLRIAGELEEMSILLPGAQYDDLLKMSGISPERAALYLKLAEDHPDLCTICMRKHYHSDPYFVDKLMKVINNDRTFDLLDRFT